MWNILNLIIFILLLQINYFLQINSNQIVKVSKYQFKKLKENVGSLTINPNIFNKNKKSKEIIINDIIEINNNYGNLLDLIFSYENWLRRFSKEYYLNDNKNKDLIKLLKNINTEFQQLKTEFNEFGKNLDLFIDNLINNQVEKNIFRDDKINKYKLKKQILNFDKQLMKLNLDMDKLRNHQNRLINSSSLYIIKLDNNQIDIQKNKTNNILKEQIKDISKENQLYDLWIYYEHNNLPDLKEKLKFISNILLLLIKQIRLIFDLLFNFKETIKYKYLRLYESNDYQQIKLNKKYYLLQNNINSMFLDSNLSICLIKNNLNKTYILNNNNNNMHVNNGIDNNNNNNNMHINNGIDNYNNNIIIDLKRIKRIIKYFIKVFEQKSYEFNKNFEYISNLNTFVTNGLEVNISNINSFFFSTNDHLKKYIFSQLNYQMDQLNTINEYVNSLEINLKYYYNNLIPCYYKVIKQYFKIIFDDLFNISKDIYPNISNDDEYNIKITHKIINFIFNITEVANSMNNTQNILEKFPTFGTKYSFESTFLDKNFLEDNSSLININ